MLRTAAPQRTTQPGRYGVEAKAEVNTGVRAPRTPLARGALDPCASRATRSPCPARPTGSRNAPAAAARRKPEKGSRRLPFSARAGTTGRSRDQRQKKARLLPTGPWKFWERMPERQVLNGATGSIVQVRKKRFLLQRTQTTPENVQVCAQSCKFLPKAAAVAQKLGRFLECD